MSNTSNQLQGFRVVERSGAKAASSPGDSSFAQHAVRRVEDAGLMPEEPTRDSLGFPIPAEFRHVHDAMARRMSKHDAEFRKTWQVSHPLLPCCVGAYSAARTSLQGIQGYSVNLERPIRTPSQEQMTEVALAGRIFSLHQTAPQGRSLKLRLFAGCADTSLQHAVHVIYLWCGRCLKTCAVRFGSISHRHVRWRRCTAPATVS